MRRWPFAEKALEPKWDEQMELALAAGDTEEGE